MSKGRYIPPPPLKSTQSHLLQTWIVRRFRDGELLGTTACSDKQDAENIKLSWEATGPGHTATIEMGTTERRLR